MKKLWIVLFIIGLWSVPGFARDFIVEFVEEHYNETQARFSQYPIIYHSIQVNSNAGSKVLILSGDDHHYRNWLRHYIAENKKFIAKVEEERVDEFITSAAYRMDVTSLHPFNGEKWGRDIMRPSKEMNIQGENNILIVDPNEKRSHLAETVIKNMGYGVLSFSSARKAIEMFELAPEKFKMVIVNYTVADMLPEEFVDQIVKTDPAKPVILDIGYNHPRIENRFKARFSGVRSVHLKQVMLRELSKTIHTLMKKNA